jgi:hypothetical protein
MEIHSYHGSVDPLWNSRAMKCPSAGPLPAVLPDGLSCDIKPAFLLAMLHQHGRKAAWGRQAAAMVRVHSYGIPQPWCAFTAMEFHGHGARSQLWNSAAMVRVHSYGIPRPWRAYTAMENHSYIDQLWNSTAMVGVHSYGIPDQVQTDSGVECTHRFPAARRVQSGPGTFALYAHFLYNLAIPSPARAWTR